MKCLYYLAPMLASTRTISDDLHAIGVKDWYIHVISNDEAGLKKERIHSSNYIETLDFLRTGLLRCLYWVLRRYVRCFSRHGYQGIWPERICCWVFFRNFNCHIFRWLAGRAVGYGHGKQKAESVS